MMKKEVIFFLVCPFALSGQVGINTSTPTAALEVVTKGNNYTTKALKVVTSSNREIFTVRNDGNVGINNPVPDATLHIVSNPSYQGRFNLIDADANAVSDVILALRNTSPIVVGKKSILGFVNKDPTSGGADWGIGTIRTNGIADYDGQDFFIANSRGADYIARIRIDPNNGNVGIGTDGNNGVTLSSTPIITAANSITAKLDVGGNMRVRTLPDQTANSSAFNRGVVADANGNLAYSTSITSASTDDWKITGNLDANITSSTDALGAAYTAGNVLGTQGAADNLVMVSGGKVGAILNTDGTLRGGNSNAAAPFSSISWGSNNTITNTTSSNIALGRNNTVGAQGANFPGIGIGYNNTLANGARAIGNNNFVTGPASFALGNGNGATITAGVPTAAGTGYAIGLNNSMNGGFALGSGNDASINAIAIGVSGIALAGESVYANSNHFFYGQLNSKDTKVSINTTPLGNADLNLKTGVRINSDTTITCNASNEGAIRYNGTTHKHEGCGYNGSSTSLSWSPLY